MPQNKNIEEWIEWMQSRSDRKARHRRLFSALDKTMPQWETFITAPYFKLWAQSRNRITEKSRLDILWELSRESFDGLSTGRLLKIAQSEIKALDSNGNIDPVKFGYRGHGLIVDKRYEVMKPLGVGGFGVVTMVFSHEVEEFFAMKTIRPDLLSDSESVARFVQEANLWVDLGNHENIVRAEFIDTVDNEITVMMELIDPDLNGCVSMQDHISIQPKRSVNQIVKWSIDICRGMAYAYSIGIKAHRDLKPENILITPSGHAKVTDFGISSLMQNPLTESSIGSSGRSKPIMETNANAIMGSFPYMPPEQFMNVRECNERSDIYSFGVILYQLISKGCWPYGDLNSLTKGIPRQDIPGQFFKLHSKGKPKFRIHKLYKIAVACLSKRPGDRPESFAVVEKMLLEATGQNEPIVAAQKKQEHFDPWETGRKAASLLRLERYEEALALFDEILEKFPIGVQWEFDKALTLSKLGRNEEALDLYSKVLKRDPEHLGALVNKGLILQKAGDLGEAEKHYLLAIKHHPDDLNALINMGNLAYKKEDFKTAISFFSKVLELDSEYDTGWYNLALAYKASSLLDPSKKCFSNFLNLSSPTDPRREYAIKCSTG